MELNFDDLAPYQSFVLARLRAGKKANDLVSLMLDDLQIILKLGSENRALQEAGEVHWNGKLEIGGFTYRVRRTAPGFKDRTRINVEHHFALVFRLGRSVALHFSEPQRYAALLRHLDRTKLPNIGKLEAFPSRILEAAFVDGPATALWLGGIHNRTTLKPDSKAINGQNLRDALDPHGDQGYYMSAGRLQPRIGAERRALGVSVFKSKIWLSASRSWAECVEITSALLHHLGSKTIGQGNPLPFLANPTELAALGPAFEMAVVPPELHLDAPSLPHAELQRLEDWYEKTSLAINRSDGNEIHATVLHSGQEIGKVRFRLQERAAGRVAVETHSASTDPRLRQLLRHCRQDQWLRIWFASGDTLTQDRIFHTQLLDYPFERFVWEKFPGCSITREKPATLAEMGTQDSLFCWTVKSWCPKGGTSWLLCDDGAMELADFIHLEKGVLTLIHEKAAASSKPDRELSVASFEVVVSQALKGLRNLHQLHLHEGVERGLRKKVASSTWHAGERASRELFLGELSGLGSNYQRRIAVVQPQLTNMNVERARTATDPQENMRYRQLMNLLNAAQGSARNLGAELIVIGQDLTSEKKLPVSVPSAATARQGRLTA